MNKTSIIALAKKSIHLCSKVVPIFSKGEKIRVVMYHGIDNVRFPVDQFEQHLKLFTKHFELFHASEIPTLLENGCKTPTGKPPIVLTFDDGLKNNATIAAPLLERYNAKATFYIISGLLGGGQMMWNHELACRLYLLSDKERNELTTEIVTPSPSVPDYDEALKLNIKKYVEQVKRWPEEEKSDLLQRLRSQYGDPQYTEEMKICYEIMSAADVLNLPSCIEVGSHSVSHAILDTVPFSRGQIEVRDSKTQLEALLQRRITTFCYPNGNYTAEVAAEAAKLYDLAVTTREGFIQPGDPMSELKRISSRINVHDMCVRLIRPN